MAGENEDDCHGPMYNLEQHVFEFFVGNVPS
jgi:hypothetical protein